MNGARPEAAALAPGLPATATRRWQRLDASAWIWLVAIGVLLLLVVLAFAVVYVKVARLDRAEGVAR